MPNCLCLNMAIASSVNVRLLWIKIIVLTDSLVDRIIIIERDICKSTCAFGVTIFDQIDMINLSKLCEVFRQQILVSRLF